MSDETTKWRSNALTKTSLALMLLALPSVLFAQGWQLGLKGIGPIRFGMPVYDAVQAIGAPLQRSTWGKECYYARPSDGPQGVGFMISEGRVARVDIWGAAVSTLSGARVGDAENDVLRRYAGRLEVSRDKYSPGNRLEFVPNDAADKAYRVVFETDGRSVQRVKAGLLPEVSWGDGCEP